jgi:sporulation protein YlmC with PRC-barrel domain
LGGFLGIGADHYPIPWPMLDYDEKLGGYRVDITEEQLKNAPKIEQGESWEQANGDRGEGVHGYWEQPAPVQERQTSSLITSDRVEGMPVYDARGKRIGKVERLMIDKLTGRIAYAILSFGGFLGIGEDHYPIPWSMLTYNEKPEASNWTSPKSNLRTPRRSNKGKTGSKRIGPATRTSTTIGKSDTIGLWNRRDPSQQFGPQWRSVS